MLAAWTRIDILLIAYSLKAAFPLSRESRDPCRRFCFNTKCQRVLLFLPNNRLIFHT